MTENKKILVNWLDLNSIKKAEQLKAKLENNNFKCVKTEKINLFEDVLIFEEIKNYVCGCI